MPAVLPENNATAGRAAWSGVGFDPHAGKLLRTAALARPVTDVRLVTEARAALLGRLGVRSVHDELLNAPHRYVDFSRVATVAGAAIGEEVTVLVTVDSVTLKRPRPRMTVVEVAAYDDTAPIMVSYFGQPWLADQFKRGMRVAFSGKVTFSYGYKRMSGAFHDVVADAPAAGPDQDRAAQSPAPSQGPRVRMLPMHRTTEGLSPAWARRLAANAVEEFGDVCDPWPARMRARLGLMPLARALRAIHFPYDADEAEEARRRLAFDEAALLQLALAARRDAHLPGVNPVAHTVDGACMGCLPEAMPFSLTADQAAAVADILTDMAAPRPMNRLVLGDVGTGKTAVAIYALVACADTGTQAAVMAPTGVLAAQYARKVGPVLDACGVTWALLTGATPAAGRARILEDLAVGATCVLFGTHALLTEDVHFARLSLAVIDEQQRFGVGQRHALREKGRGADLLVMTATPIPRTLALTLYGDLASSYLTERPVKGAGIETRVIKKGDRGVAYEAMRTAIAQGRQAYVICPLVGAPAPKDDETPDGAAGELAGGADPSDAKAAEDEAEALQRTVFPQARVGLLTGRMRPAQKQAVMEDFKEGRIDVLVSTTVVEVGVDVPNATVMLIEDGERFGLAQLHQLRGRVGRGAHPGLVFIAADTRSATAKERLAALEATSDGFALAEADLRLRREGDIMGARQSGDASLLRFVDLARDLDLVRSAHEQADALLRDDPQLRSTALAPVRAAVIDRYGDVFKEVSGG